MHTRSTRSDKCSSANADAARATAVAPGSVQRTAWLADLPYAAAAERTSFGWHRQRAFLWQDETRDGSACAGSSRRVRRHKIRLHRHRRHERRAHFVTVASWRAAGVSALNGASGDEQERPPRAGERMARSCTALSTPPTAVARGKALPRRPRRSPWRRTARRVGQYGTPAGRATPPGQGRWERRRQWVCRVVSRAANRCGRESMRRRERVRAARTEAAAGQSRRRRRAARIALETMANDSYLAADDTLGDNNGQRLFVLSLDVHLQHVPAPNPRRAPHRHCARHHLHLHPAAAACTWTHTQHRQMW